MNPPFNTPLQCILLLSCILLLRPESSRADSAALSRFGINEHIFRYSDYDAECNEIIASGIKWIRIGPDWGTLQPNAPSGTNDGYSMTEMNKLDDIVNRLTSKGVNILWTLCYCADWASSAPANVSGRRFYPPANLTHWDDFVTKICNKYKGKVFYWEVWNEEDNATFWRTNLAEDRVAKYRELLQHASERIRAVDPNNKVLLGGLTGAGAPFLSQLINTSSVGGYFDIMNYHTYQDSAGMVATYKEFTGVMNSRQIASKPIWITEFGYSTNNNPALEFNKADWVDQGYVTHFSMPGVERLFWYVYRNTNNPGEDNYKGLETTDRIPLKAHSCYQAEDGAESNFLLQKNYPSQTPGRLCLTYVSNATGDGVVNDYAADGSTKSVPAGNYMYCRINDDWTYDTDGGLVPKVTVDVTFWDATSNSWALQYQSQSSNTQSILVPRGNTSQWVTRTFTLDAVKFANGQNWQSDFRLFAGGVTPLIVSKIVVRKEINVARVVLGTAARFRLLEHVVETDPAKDAYNPVTSIGGRECRMMANGGKFMYFRVCDGVVREGNPNVTVGIRYYDTGSGNITIQYLSTSSGATYVNAPPVAKGNTNTWRYVTFTLSNAKFDSSKAYGSDFRIYSGSDYSPEYVDMVDVRKN